MKVSVEGWRFSASEWNEVRDVPVTELPPLSPEQASVAKKMRIPAADYARSALAGERSGQFLLAKTARLASLLDERLASRTPGVRVASVTLETWEHKFRVTTHGELETVFRVKEDVVDDLFEGGSREADERIERVVELVLHDKVA